MEQTIIYNLARLNDAVTQSTDPEQQLRALIKSELISITGDTGAAHGCVGVRMVRSIKRKARLSFKNA